MYSSSHISCSIPVYWVPESTRYTSHRSRAYSQWQGRDCRDKEEGPVGVFYVLVGVSYGLVGVSYDLVGVYYGIVGVSFGLVGVSFGLVGVSYR